MNIIKIKQGITFEGFGSALGFIIFIIGVINFFYSSIYSALSLLFLLISIIGLMLFLSIKGILIDIDNRKIKPYMHFPFFRIGKWVSLDMFEEITLKYTHVSQRMSIGLSPSNKVTTQTFDILLTSETAKPLLIKEFTDYELAKDFLAQYSSLLNLEKFDQYELMKMKLAERRKNMRR